MIHFKQNSKRLATLAIPLILSQVGQVVVGLADNLMVGRVSSKYLAASSLANSVLFLIIALGMGLLFGITPIVGKTFGEGNIKKVDRIFKNSIVYGAIVLIGILIVCGVIGMLMPYMGQEEETLRLALPYYWILVASMIPFLMFCIFKQFAEGIANTKYAMMITVVSNLLNIFLNYVFIYGKFGFDAYYLNGAGIATLISRILMPIAFVIIFCKSTVFKEYSLKIKKSLISKADIKHIFSTGLPIGTQMVVEALMFSLSAIMVGWIGANSLAAHQIVLYMSSLSFMFSNGLAQATTIRVSNLWGQKKKEDILTTIKISRGFVAIFMATMGSIYLVSRHFLPSLFVSEQEVLDIAAGLLLMVSIYQLFDGLQVVGLGVLRGFSDVKVPMILAAISYLGIGIPMSYICGFVLKFSTQGVWCGLVCGLFVASILFWIRVRSTLKKDIAFNK